MPLDWDRKLWMKAMSYLWSSLELFFLTVLAGRAWLPPENGSHLILLHLWQSSCWSYYEGTVFENRQVRNQSLLKIFRSNDACIQHPALLMHVINSQSYTPSISLSIQICGHESSLCLLFALHFICTYNLVFPYSKYPLEQVNRMLGKPIWPFLNEQFEAFLFLFY